jgi:prephenate dehydrogenase
MSEKLFIPRLAIIGVGLIGGSLALALKAAGAVGEVVGIGRGLANLERALELGVVDRISRDAAEGVRDADLVFLATPVLALPEVAAAIAPHLKPGAILTDGGSVKGSVARGVERGPNSRSSCWTLPRTSNRLARNAASMATTAKMMSPVNQADCG